MRNRFQTLIISLLLLIAQSPAWSQIPKLSSYPSARPAIFLDFDGQYVNTPYWNSGNPFYCNPSTLTNEQVIEIFNRVAEDFRPFNLNITTDSTAYFNAPINQRTRVIITNSYEWYGVTGGVSWITSFSKGMEIPCFVFSSLHNNRVKDVAEAISHEAGHTLGLYHQSLYDASCQKTEYNPGMGSGEIGWAPIMGVGYNKNFTLWNNGKNAIGCAVIQSDLDVITGTKNGLTYRTDDHGSDFTSATQLAMSNLEFVASGVVEKSVDDDFFKFTIAGDGRFQLNAIPYNVGTGNAGSDLDMQITLYDDAKNQLSIFNPGTLLNSIADTMLNSGIYYMKVEGKGNINTSEYGSLGSYSLSAKITIGNAVLPLHKLKLNGTSNNGYHKLSWDIIADEKIISQTLENSFNGKDYTAIVSPGLNIHTYSLRPEETHPVTQYRLNVSFENGSRYYSNIVSIKDQQPTKPALTANMIYGESIYVNSPGEYAYEVVTMNGTRLARGKLVSGINLLTVKNMAAGIYLIRFSNNRDQYTEKLIHQ